MSLLISPDNQFYFSGFKALLYSRPIVYAVHGEHTSIIIPGLEEAHAQHDRAADQILVYYEHPERAHRGKTHLEHLDRLLSAYPSGSRIGIELESCPASLARYLEQQGFEVADVGRKIVEMRYVKDPEEIERMRQAGRLVDLVMRESVAACRPGVTEIEVDSAGSVALFEETAREHPEAMLEILVMSPSGVKRSVMPHVHSNTRRLEEGDVLIHTRQVALNGYRAELERTLIVGEPSERQRKAFEAARQAQQAALDFVRPGVAAREVDRVAREVLREAGFVEYAIHRVGHGLGISAHEEPYLRFDSGLVLEEGMVYTIEPGIYVPGLGGFRHSDTVVLTSDGCDPITDFPTDLDSLTRR